MCLYIVVLSHIIPTLAFLQCFIAVVCLIKWMNIYSLAHFPFMPLAYHGYCWPMVCLIINWNLPNFSQNLPVHVIEMWLLMCNLWSWDMYVKVALVTCFPSFISKNLKWYLTYQINRVLFYCFPLFYQMALDLERKKIWATPIKQLD